MHDLVISWGAFSAHIPPWVLYLAPLPGFGLMHSKRRLTRRGAVPPATLTRHSMTPSQKSDELGASSIPNQARIAQPETFVPNL